MRNLAVTICLSVFAIALNGAGEKSQAIVNEFLKSKGLANATVGLMVKDVENGKVVAENRPQANMIPASITKALTTATALQTLTDTFRFATRLATDGYVKDSVLHGNLYVVGGGDPTLESDYYVHDTIFQKMAHAVQQYGIAHIEGKIIGDASSYTRKGVPGSWLVEDAGTYYGVTPSALSFNDNQFIITYLGQDSGEVAIVENVRPANRLLKIDSRMKSCANPKSKWWNIHGDSYSWQKIIRGSVPAHRKTVVRVEIPDPGLLVADSLRHTLGSLGIGSKASGTTLWAADTLPRKLSNIYIHYSLPLSDIIATTNFNSVNLFAENIYLRMGLGSDTVPGLSTFESSAASIRKYWASKGLNAAGIHQVDGSGLSMKNAINPAFLTEVLCYMKTQSPYADAFYKSLPVAGVNGTVKTFLRKTALQGQVRCKSGSMERVQNYCGYINYNKRNYAFTLMVHNFTCTRAELRQAMAQMLTRLMWNEKNGGN